MDIQNLTLDELTTANARAEGSKAGRDAYNTMLAALAEAPQTRERLAFDMVKAAERFVTESAEPGLLACWIRQWGKYVRGPKLQEFTTLVEGLIVHYCERVGGFELSTPEITLHVLFTAIRESQPLRLASTLQKVRVLCESATPGDVRLEIVKEFERGTAKA
jgi:hypothetical protein